MVFKLLSGSLQEITSNLAQEFQDNDDLRFKSTELEHGNDIFVVLGVFVVKINEGKANYILLSAEVLFLICVIFLEKLKICEYCL